MSGLIDPFTAGLFVSAGISFAIAIYIQRWRDTPGILAFTLQMIFQAVWALGFAFETLAPDLVTKLWFRKIAWIGIILAPLCWSEFVLRYTRNSGWINRRVGIGIAIPFFFLLVAAFTNEWHYWFWSSTVLAPGIGTGVLYGRGPLFWLAIGMAYAVVVTALTELIWAANRAPHLYRRQAYVLIFAGGIPLVTSLLFVLKITQPYDWTPLGFAVTGIVVSWAIFRYRLFTMAPVARGKLFEIVPDGLLALDPLNRVVDANPVLLEIAGYKDRLPLGTEVESLFAAEKELLTQMLEVDGGEERVIRASGSQRSFAVTATPLEISPRSPEGKLFVFRDVTAREEAEQRLRLNEESMRRLFEANPFPLAMVGTDYATLYAFNQAFMDFFGATADGFANRRASSFLAGKEAKKALAHALIREEKIQGKMVDVRNAVGEVRTVLLNVERIDFLGKDRLLVSFADISDRLLLEQAEREQHVLSEILRETATWINSTLELDEVLDRILVNLRRVLNYDAASIMLVDDEGVASVARTRGFIERGLESPFGKVWMQVDSTPNLRRMMVSHQPDLIMDVAADPDWLMTPGEDWVRANLSAPIFTSDKIVGFLQLSSAEKNAFNEKDAERLMVFANQASAAIDNARLYSRLRKAAKETEVLGQITLAAASSLDFNVVIERIFELINRLVPSDSSGIQLIEGNELVLKAFRGFKDSEAILGTRWPFAGTANEEVFRARRPLIFSDVQAKFEGYRVAPHNQIRSVLIIPLIAGGEVIGFLSLDSWVLAYFSEDDLRLANLFAGDIAAVLENARLYEESRRRSAELEILNRAAMAVTSGLDLDHVLKMLYEQCLQVMPADTFYVALYDEESGEIKFPIFQDQGIYRQVQPVNIHTQKGMTGCVIEEKRTIYLPDSMAPSAEKQYQLIRFGGIPTRAYLGVPIFVREKVIGVISMQSTIPNAYSPDQVRVLETITSHAAIAIENARLYMQAQTAAITDDLTSLLTRRELFRRAEHELERATRYRHHLAVVMIDFDHFKTINDMYGHQAGDHVLRSMARICQENMRLVDVVGRYGGEEILVLMPETTVEQAERASERLRRQIDETVVTFEGVELTVTISAGVAGMGPDGGLTLEMLITRADAALFMAKSAGRNQVCISTE